MEPNDTLLTATQTGIEPGDIGEFTFSGTLDNDGGFNSVDVDLYALEVSVNTSVLFDLDSSFYLLRVFDADGNELASDEGDIFESFEAPFIGFKPPEAGT